MNAQPTLMITGASGFTGLHACQHFLRKGFDVIGVTRSASISDSIRTEHCDLTDKEAARELTEKIKPQYLLHLAGQNHAGQSWHDPAASIETNTMATLYVLEALRTAAPGCKSVIVGSALQFNPNDLSALTHPYSLSKTLQVLVARSWEKLYNMHIVIAKPSNLIGPGFSNGVCSILAGKIADMELGKTERILEVTNLQAQRDFVDVRDAVSAYETLLQKGKSGKLYEIASGRSRSLGEITNVLKTLTDVAFEVRTEINNHQERPVKTAPETLMELGWKPVIPLKSSLKDLLDFYRSNV
jgi:GDP-4-dehydro-6-deoxy-D-mannose reductase